MFVETTMHLAPGTNNFYDPADVYFTLGKLFFCNEEVRGPATLTIQDFPGKIGLKYSGLGETF